MTPRAKKDSDKLREDAAETAFRVLQEAIGERPRTAPPGERPEKNPEAVRRGRKGGLKGGSGRAKKLSARKRKNIASIAARKRWEGQNPNPGK